LLIPQEKLTAVLAILADDASKSIQPSQSSQENPRSLNDDPWQGLLGETE
jgi:hypothetical protein